MKRLHVHLSVTDLEASVGFYSTLFAASPTVHKTDYAKWMLEDPRVNFAISRRGAAPGVQELGIQAESHQELEEMYERVKRMERPVLDEGTTTCCYAQSDKRWVEDPQGQEWEIFLTLGQSEVFGTERRPFDPPKLEPDCCARNACGAPGATG